MAKTIQLRLSLPDDLAREVEASGLLEPRSLTELLRNEARKRRLEKSKSPQIKTAVARAQELVRCYVPEGTSLADELIEERRAEGKRHPGKRNPRSPRGIEARSSSL